MWELLTSLQIVIARLWLLVVSTLLLLTLQHIVLIHLFSHSLPRKTLSALLLGRGVSGAGSSAIYGLRVGPVWRVGGVLQVLVLGRSRHVNATAVFPRLFMHYFIEAFLQTADAVLLLALGRHGFLFVLLDSCIDRVMLFLQRGAVRGINLLVYLGGDHRPWHFLDFQFFFLFARDGLG